MAVAKKKVRRLTMKQMRVCLKMGYAKISRIQDFPELFIGCFILITLWAYTYIPIAVYTVYPIFGQKGVNGLLLGHVYGKPWFLLPTSTHHVVERLLYLCFLFFLYRVHIIVRYGNRLWCVRIGISLSPW